MSKCGFEQREGVGISYWKDKRWKKVTKLRRDKQDSKANALVMEIRKSWGVD